MAPLVGLIMGSRSDWETMRHAAETLEALGIPYEVRVVSAHRTPDLMAEYAKTAEERGIQVIIAGAGGGPPPRHDRGPHRPPRPRGAGGKPGPRGLRLLLSIVQMPAGVPVGTLAIGKAGAVNAALLAASILGLKHPEILKRLKAYRKAQTEAVLAHPDPREEA